MNTNTPRGPERPGAKHDEKKPSKVDEAKEAVRQKVNDTLGKKSR